MKIICQCSTVVLIALFVLAFGTVVEARDSPNGPIPEVASPSAKIISDVAPEAAAQKAFGGNYQWKVLHVADWNPWDGTANPEYWGGTGYIYPAETGWSGYWAQVNLPVGAQVNALFWMIYDNDASCTWNLDFHKYEAGEGANAPDYVSIDFENLPAGDTPGYYQLTKNFFSDQPVIRSYDDIQPDGIFEYTSYNVSAYLSGCTGSLSDMRLFGVVFNWERVITPAPASATFSDVGTGHWSFQNVEALVAAGITQGCGNGEYCPAQAVTRAEMAAFLARALGLHWPY